MDLDEHLPDIASGDADAFGRWVAGAEEPLRCSLASFARAVDTEAVIQEALLRTWQIAPRVRPDGAGNSLLRVARRIARNCAISEVRRTRPVGVDPSALAALADPDPVEPALPDPALRAAIAACCDKLPPAPRRALDLRLWARGGATDRQLAARARQSVDAFLKAFSRARTLLATCLQRRGIDVAYRAGTGGAR